MCPASYPWKYDKQISWKQSNPTWEVFSKMIDISINNDIFLLNNPVVGISAHSQLVGNGKALCQVKFPGSLITHGISFPIGSSSLRCPLFDSEVSSHSRTPSHRPTLAQYCGENPGERGSNRLAYSAREPTPDQSNNGTKVQP